MRSRLLLAALPLLFAGCGGPETTTSDEPADGSAAEPSGVTLTTSDSELGEILVDGEGRSLYLFTSDTGGESSCYDDCEANWPPLTGEVTVEGNADETLVGATEREDGSSQVVYNDYPLYYFAGDEEPGDTNGQGVNDVWFAISPSGAPVEDAEDDDGDDGDDNGSGYGY